MTKSRDDFYGQWVRLGAQMRLKELLDERAEIYRVFPELRTEGKEPRRFSSRGKSAISDGMRRYWAKRKAAAMSGKAAGTN